MVATSSPTLPSSWVNDPTTIRPVLSPVTARTGNAADERDGTDDRQGGRADADRAGRRGRVVHGEVGVGPRGEGADVRVHVDPAEVAQEAVGVIRPVPVPAVPGRPTPVPPPPAP